MRARDRRRGCAAALVACIAAAGAARAADLGAQADVQYGRNRTGGVESASLEQLYTLQLRQRVSDPLAYVLGVRVAESLRDADTADSPRTDEVTSVYPSARVSYLLDALRLSSGVDWARDAARSGGADLVRRRLRWDAVGSYRWSELVAANGGGAISRMQDSAGLDQEDARASLGGDWANGRGLQLHLASTAAQTRDLRLGVTRATVGPTVSVAYGGSRGQDVTWSVTHRSDVAWSRAESISGSGVPKEERPARATYAIDPDPVVPSGVTPVENASLIDQNLDASAGIALGPGAPADQTIGIDLGRVASLDELRVSVRDDRGDLVVKPGAGALEWTAYTSVDGVRWIAMTPGAAAAFADSLSAWVVTFTPATARYFKVKILGWSQDPTFVTEIQAFVHEALGESRTRHDVAYRQATGLTASWTATPWLGVSYSGLLNGQWTWRQSDTTGREVDWSNALDCRLGPFGAWTASAGASQRAALLGATRLEGESYQAGVGYAPIPRLNASGALSYGVDRVGGTTGRTATATIGAGAQPWEDVKVSASVSTGRQRVGGSSTGFVGASANAAIRLTGGADLALSSSFQRLIGGEATPPVAGSLIPRVFPFQRHVAELRLVVSSQLTAFGRVGYLQAVRSGLVTGVGGSWNPLPGGTFTVSMGYDQDVDSITGNSARRLYVSPAWAVNRWATLSASYSWVRTESVTQALTGKQFIVLLRLRS
jgi:hypothetical protein